MSECKHCYEKNKRISCLEHNLHEHQRMAESQLDDEIMTLMSAIIKYVEPDFGDPTDFTKIAEALAVLKNEKERIRGRIFGDRIRAALYGKNE